MLDPSCIRRPHADAEGNLLQEPHVAISSMTYIVLPYLYVDPTILPSSRAYYYALHRKRKNPGASATSFSPRRTHLHHSVHRCAHHYKQLLRQWSPSHSQERSRQRIETPNTAIRCSWTEHFLLDWIQRFITSISSWLRVGNTQHRTSNIQYHATFTRQRPSTITHNIQPNPCKQRFLRKQLRTSGSRLGPLRTLTH